MVATNVGGIAWTIYNCFFSDHHEVEEKSSEVSSDFANPETLKQDFTARVSIRSKWRNRRI